MVLSYIDFDVFGVERLEADQYSSAGYVLTLLAIISIFVVWFGFVDPPKAPVVADDSDDVPRGIDT